MMAKKTLLSIFVLAALLPQTFIQASSDSILISQLQIANKTSKDEFIELFNNSEEEILITDWKLVKKTKSGNSQNIVSSFPEIILSPRSHLLITPEETFSGKALPDLHYSSSNTLADNNALFLIDENGNVIDSISWGENTLGENSPSPTPDAGKSLNRIQDENNLKIDTDNNALDFILLENPIPKNSFFESSTEAIELIPTEEIENNLEQEEETKPNEEEPVSEPTPNAILSEAPAPLHLIRPQSILINEIYPSPLSGEKEWLELYNNSSTHLFLDNCYIQEGSNRKTILKGSINARQYFLVNKISGSLNNSGDDLYLYCHEILIDQISYNESNQLIPQKGFSISRISEGLDQTKFTDFTLSTAPTPNGVNKIIIPIKEPSPMNTATESPTIEEKPSKEIPKQNIEKEIPTEEIIIFEIPKNSPEKEDSLPLEELDSEIVSIKKVLPIPVENLPLEKEYLSLQISEFLPNPEGKDDKEWIEIFNPNETEILLEGWILDDKEGQSKPYIFSAEKIQAQEYLILSREKTKITLNNSEDEIRLMSPDKKLIDSIDYEETQENLSHAFNLETQKWQWTSTLTPAKSNQFTSPPIKQSKTSSNQIFINGVISVLPNGLYKNSIFIEPSGHEIYLSKENFPELKLGQSISVWGKLSTTKKRITLQGSHQIKILAEIESLSPPLLELAEITEEHSGKLLKITGFITSSKSGKLMIEDETNEFMIYLKNKELRNQEIQEGDQVEVTGIIMPYSKELRILPRSNEDIVIIKKAIIPEISPLNTQENSLLPPKNKQNNVLLPLSLASNFILLLYLAFIYQQKLAIPVQKKACNG